MSVSLTRPLDRVEAFAYHSDLQRFLMNSKDAGGPYPPRWTSSGKEGVGTAYSDASRVWFTRLTAASGAQ